ncbi:exopolysaccharide biosynthesis polyprenyl glycosylphosphotransferase [Geovibrio thiophilus]|uniref:Exopolysaccharide biosynthesis polyprenyl glycosylphosphotransferase n=1 Tax=Geovibrio thiophilus TaxID=139438 RepID=A0A410JZC8_9BACT|nr:exopolysaccharide biosynthesis polyprenyl glycosylphosphotransferase [Geovibrio thiophilus]QAR33524.1 exopolysaccharide biosynthesis polyprenyl glycosylphosphotransferase [Geovibrio thiophilus]
MRWMFTPAVILTDLLTYYLTLEAAVVSRSIVDILFPEVTRFGFSFTYFAGIWWMPLILLSVIAYKGLYTRRLTTFDETRGLISAVTFSLVLIFAIVSVGKMTDMVSRLTLVFIWFYGILLFPVARRIGKRLLFSLGLGTEKIIIAGTGESAAEAAAALLGEKGYGYKLKGFYPVSACDAETIKVRGTSYPVLGGDIEKLLDDASAVVFVEDEMNPDEITSLTTCVRRKVGKIITVPEPGRAAMMNSEFHYLFNNKLFILKSKNNLASVANKAAKRAFDIVFTLLVLPFAGLIIITAAVAIRLESGGSPFYSHKRVGRGGKVIGVLKMRSMYKDADVRLKDILDSDPVKRAEWETSFKLKDDPRVTKVGRFIRKTSIDEMPQFINVLRGDMSVVGPRPIIRTELDEYYGKDGEYYCMVRPGITGIWQVSGRSDTDYTFRVGLDSWYVMNWSIWLDIMIILKTVKAVIKKEGAY